jgi:hypothetical protein
MVQIIKLCWTPQVMDTVQVVLHNPYQNQQGRVKEHWRVPHTKHGSALLEWTSMELVARG